MPLLPILVISAILGIESFIKIDGFNFVKYSTVISIITVTFIVTFIFDIAMLKGLTQKNPHQQLAEYINQNTKGVKTILLYAPDWEWYEFENIRKVTKEQKGIEILDERQVIDRKIKPDLILVFQFDNSEGISIKMKDVLSSNMIRSSELKRKLFIPLQCGNFTFDYHRDCARRRIFGLCQCGLGADWFDCRSE